MIVLLSFYLWMQDEIEEEICFAAIASFIIDNPANGWPIFNGWDYLMSS